MRLIFLISMVTLLCACQSGGRTKTLKLAHGLDVNHSVHKAMLRMAEILEGKSEGKLRLEIYPSEQLGTERQCLELLQIGSLDITKVSVGVIENFIPSMKIFGLPYVFRDKEHSFQVMDGPIGKELLAGGEQYWLKGLNFYDAGSRSFYTVNRPVHTPKDLEGLKLRVMESVTAMDMVRSLGGSPTPISWGELYTALQQGVVDGAENNAPSFYLSRHYEVCKYYSLDEHTILPDILIIGTHSWNGLSLEERTWLQHAADESVIYQRKLWAEAEQEALEEVEKAGVEIIRPDKNAFKAGVKELLNSYKRDSLLFPIIKKISSVP